jgi:hypothetical protein
MTEAFRCCRDFEEGWSALWRDVEIFSSTTSFSNQKRQSSQYHGTVSRPHTAAVNYVGYFPDSQIPSGSPRAARAYGEQETMHATLTQLQRWGGCHCKGGTGIGSAAEEARHNAQGPFTDTSTIDSSVYALGIRFKKFVCHSVVQTY